MKFLRGNAACPGCPIPKELDTILNIYGEKTVIVVPASCSTVIMGDTVNGMPSTVNVVHSPFAASASIASGIAAAMRHRNEDANVLVWAGDGSTSDIGFAALSGAAERNENITYVCYDNEAYMNTGVQRSSLTPYGAWTTTTPEHKHELKKPMPFLMAMHGIPYVATASISYMPDFISKFRKAESIEGFRYIHLLSPCPPGWKFDSSLTLDIGKLAVETGMWPLYEIENGILKLSSISANYVDKAKRKPLSEYIKVQDRFKGLSEAELAGMQDYIDRMWNYISELKNSKKAFF
ncbi:MAG: 3-methyl-2-oxobutanoate dehydrogenase subunit beta [Candidatus Micrarchaeia archaeon]